MSRLITRDFQFEYKAKSSDSGTFEGYASTFNNEDTSGDVVVPGAFKKSLAARAARGQKLKMLWNHKRDEPIGIYTAASEDASGLYVKGEFTPGVKKADEVRASMLHGAIDSMSIGGYVNVETWDKTKGLMYLNEIDLQEVSPVTFPANKEARISTVKSIEQFGIMSELEAHLRDVGGFSLKEAKAIIAKARGFDVAPRDVAPDAAQVLKEAVSKMLATINNR